MNKHAQHSKTPLAKSVANFAGFDDWFEVFRGGNQTDSAGNTRFFSDADLDSIVANHDAGEPAPLVVGHPKTNDPAFGWSAALKREGNVLLAKATDVVKEFEDAVRTRMYPNRSVSIAPDGNGGFKLVHIGFLGAAAPAVSGLKRLYNASTTEQVMEFSWDVNQTQRSLAWGLRAIGDVLRRLRDAMIEQTSVADADNLIPSYQIDSIQQQAAELLEQSSSSDFNSSSKGASMKPNQQAAGEQTFTKAELDAAVAAAKATGDAAQAELAALRKKDLEKQFADAQAKTKSIIEKLVADGRITPADAAGIAEFCGSLQGTEGPVTFEFTAADGKTKSSVNQLEFMHSLLSKIDGKAIQLGKDKSAPPADGSQVNFSQWDGHNVDPAKLEIYNKAQEYMKQNKVTYEVALNAVMK